ncbi:MAG: hypothetical protein IJ080_09520, partial [Oscillospiraceae bacterium]|nr:hypothetical protein [Oscillospiraceae bacterium]
VTDCGGWSDAAQAAMLKVTEDPPDPVYFVFTGEDLTTFLPTLISRSVTIGITEADREGCMEYLRDTYPDRSEDEMMRPAAAFGGNIGRCAQYMDGSEELLDIVERVRRTSAALSVSDEYTVAVVLSGIKDRDVFKGLLGMLTAVIRDAAAAKAGDGRGISCDPNASKLAGFSYGRLMRIYDCLAAGMRLCGTNCNLESLSAMLAGQLCS